jgi:hypothetical protein
VLIILLIESTIIIGQTRVKPESNPGHVSRPHSPLAGRHHVQRSVRVPLCGVNTSISFVAKAGGRPGYKSPLAVPPRARTTVCRRSLCCLRGVATPAHFHSRLTCPAPLLAPTGADRASPFLAPALAGAGGPAASAAELAHQSRPELHIRRKSNLGDPLSLLRTFPGRERHRLAGIPAGHTALAPGTQLLQFQSSQGLNRDAGAYL